MSRRDATSVELRNVVFSTTSTLLSYPSEHGDEALVEVKERLTTLDPVTASLVPLIEHRCATSLIALQSEYVATFDLKRRFTLHLTYYLNGDTRRRGMELLHFQQVLAECGYQVTNGELPDFLPVVLELGAREQGEQAVTLLTAHRAGLEILAQSLAEARSPYAAAILAVESVLPAAAVGARANARLLMAQGPPREDVGLEFLTVGSAHGYGASAASEEVRR